MASRTQLEAEHDAEDLLVTVWATGEHVPVPVDPVAIARRLSIDVLVAGMKEGVSGALSLQPDAAPTIYLNREDAKVRQRFTCAHEIGHFMRAIKRGETSLQRVDFRASMASRGTDVEEIYANTFAASLLMPRSVIESMRDRHPVDMAFQLEVSAEAMSNRLAYLRTR